MAQLEYINSLTPLEFIEFCFNNPVERKAWFWTYLNNYRPDKIELANNLVFLFDNLEIVTSQYSEDEIAQGFDFILNIGSNYFNALRPLRLENFKLYSEVYLSFINVIDNIFNIKCIPELSGGSKADISYLNTIVYMLWDNGSFGSPLFFMEESEIHPILFKLLEKQLSSSNIAVQESAIHGLGHIEYVHPKYVRKVLWNYIKTCDNQNLKRYAEFAITGRIL